MKNLRLCLKVTLVGFSTIEFPTTTAKGTNGEILIEAYQQVSSITANATFDMPISSGETVRAKAGTVIIIWIPTRLSILPYIQLIL